MTRRAVVVGLGLVAFVWVSAGVAAQQVLTATDAWVRQPAVSRDVTGAYVTITNSGTTDRRLVKVTSPAARTVEMHTMTMKDDVMSMEQVTGIDVPAGGRAELKPGGLHLMLFGLAERPQPGTPIRFVLTFDDESVVTVDADVRAPGDLQ